MSPRKRSAVVCHRALFYSIFISVLHKDPELIYIKFMAITKLRKVNIAIDVRIKSSKLTSRNTRLKPQNKIWHIKM